MHHTGNNSMSKIFYRQSFIIAYVITCLAASSCRKNEDSKLGSLTSSELESCKFDGLRLMVLVAPFFPQDVYKLRDHFVKFHSQTQLMSRSYISERVKNHP